MLNTNKIFLKSKKTLMKLLDQNDSNPFIDNLLNECVLIKVSDIHFEPFENLLRIRIRINGELYSFLDVDNIFKNNIITKLKIHSEMNLAENRFPQDGRFSINFEKRKIDIRASSLPTINGEKIVLRILDPLSFY